MVGAPPVLHCPADNTVEGAEPEIIIGEYPKVDCKICGIHAVVPGGVSAGFAHASLIFGRNQKDGQVNESLVSSYRMYAGDSSGHKLPGVPWGEAQVDVSSEACCGHAYNITSPSFNVTQSLPASVVIVPVDVSGYEMPVGQHLQLDPVAFGMDSDSNSEESRINDYVSQARQTAYIIGPLAVVMFAWIRTVG